MRKRFKQGGAIVLALVLSVSAGIAWQVRAAVGIDTDQSCSVKIELDGTYPELNDLDIPVRLYRIAEVSESGNYTMLPGFEDLKLEDIDEKITAQEWEEKAKAASDIVEETMTDPDMEMSVKNTGTARGLDTGMYLVEAETVQSPYHTYQFNPFLLALPNNYYYSGEADDWVYNVTTGLKPDEEERFGDLVIEKSLSTYNQTLGEATFVFSVEAVKEDEVVYSDVVSVAFSSAGKQEILVKDIPAGASVTVTEVYSGSSYESTGAHQQTVEIVAQEEGVEPVSVSFANDYNHGFNGGSGVVNHFAYSEPEGVDEDETQSGTWEWKQYRDSTESEK